MGIPDAERLQLEIDESIRIRNINDISITLDHDADVLNLDDNVNLRVTVKGRPFREFTIVSPLFLNSVLPQIGLDHDSAQDPQSVYCTGGPLCVVRRITGESVVTAVTRFLHMEASSSQ